jgi:hypothetical protein
VLIDDDESGEDGEESTLDSDLFKSPTAKHFRPTIFVKKSPQLTYHAKLSMYFLSEIILGILFPQLQFVLIPNHPQLFNVVCVVQNELVFRDCNHI